MNQQLYPGNVLVVARASPLCVQWRDALALLGLCAQCAECLEAAQHFMAVAPDWIEYLIIDPDLPDGDGTPQFVRCVLGHEQPPTVAVILHQLDDTALLDMASHGVQLVPKPLTQTGIRLLVGLLQRRRHAQYGLVTFARRYHLSPRETEVLEAQFNGASDKTIAQILNSTEHAVNQTIRRIHKKLGASTFREIVSQWRRYVADANSSTDDVAPSSTSP